MSVKKIVRKQYQDIVDRARLQESCGLRVPNEGWIRTVRKALNMSGVQLARRLGMTRGLVSNTEKAELSGSVTIKNMQQMAEALGCRFVYAIVPDQSVKNVIDSRAREKAKQIVSKTSEHMALEKQDLSKDQIKFELDRLQQQFVEELSSDLWND